MRKSYAYYYQKERQNYINNFGGECCVCGTTSKLVFHHTDFSIIGNGRGSWNGLLELREQISRAENYTIVLVCTFCHRKIHRLNKVIG